jgi:hypothetical protein
LVRIEQGVCSRQQADIKRETVWWTRPSALTGPVEKRT